MIKLSYIKTFQPELPYCWVMKLAKCGLFSFVGLKLHGHFANVVGSKKKLLSAVHSLITRLLLQVGYVTNYSFFSWTSLWRPKT